MKKSGGKELLETLKTVFFAIIIALFVRTFAAEPFNIPSGSMIPTLLVGDYLFVSKYSYGYSRHSLPFSIPIIPGRIVSSEPRLGDVAVFKTPVDNRTDFIKRIVGLPGDKVQLKNGVLFINDKAVKRRRLPDSAIKDAVGNLKTVARYEVTLPNGARHQIQESEGDSGWLDNTPKFSVPPDHFFTLGDNRDNSSDSRVFGFVPMKNLVGKAEFLFFSIKGSSAWKIWNWYSSVRVDRLLKKLK